MLRRKERGEKTGAGGAPRKEKFRFIAQKKRKTDRLPSRGKEKGEMGPVGVITS